MLERVRDEVADRLRQPDPVAAHEDVRRDRPDPQLAAEDRRDRLPGGRLVGNQLADLDDLGAIGRLTAAPRRREVVEREAGALELEVDGGEPRARRVARVQREVRRGERAAQLVARAAVRATRARRP